MFSELSASGYKYSSIFYNEEFEDVFSKIIACYEMMINTNIEVESDENVIRDFLLKNYLKNNAIRNELKLTDFLFDREVPEDNDLGRTDIKIQTRNTFQDTKAYYIIECKRLDCQNQYGKTGLNGIYISEGICRFTSSKYSCYYKTNGMLGFVVQPMNIQDNIVCINNILNNSDFPSNTRQNIKHRKLVDNFDYSYYSTHTIGDDEIVIYHLMLDFSSNIKGKSEIA